MLTIETLKEFGADTDVGVARCFGNNDFYLKLVRTVPDEKSFDQLSDAVAAGDLDTAFDMAHALKGVLANLSLTPIRKPVEEITEQLRSRAQMDYSELLSEITKQRELLRELCQE